MKTTASIRTANPLLTWELAKNRKHDVSMIDTPEVWLFIQVDGTYFPYSSG